MHLVLQATLDMELKHAEVDEKKARDLLGHANFERDKAIRKLKRGYIALEKAQVCTGYQTSAGTHPEH